MSVIETLEQEAYRNYTFENGVDNSTYIFTPKQLELYKQSIIDHCAKIAEDCYEYNELSQVPHYIRKQNRLTDDYLGLG